MGNVVRPSVSPEWAVAATVNNGANLTANKVEPTATHKSVGYSYPEQPARNHTNWWMNAVYQWVDYIDAWISKWGSINKNFAMDDVLTTGLTFAYNAGKVSVAVFTNLTAAAGTLTLSDGDGTYSIYFDCLDSTVKKLVSTVPISNDTIVPLYSVPVVAGVIDTANIVDLRTFNTIRKATAAEVATGTDKDKYITPFTAAALATPSASTSVFGKVRLADAADVLAQLGDDVLTAGSLAFTQMRASISKYGTVRLADNTDLLPANRAASDDVLTAASLTQSNILATAADAGTVRLADNTDLALANRAGNNDVLTAASLTQTNMQATSTAAGIIELATLAEVTAGTDDTRAVTPDTLRDAGYIRIFETAYQTYTSYTARTFYNPNGVANGAIAFKDYKFFMRCKTAEHGYSVGMIIPLYDCFQSATNEYGFTSVQIPGLSGNKDGVVLSPDTNHDLLIHGYGSTGGGQITSGYWEIKCVFYV